MFDYLLKGILSVMAIKLMDNYRHLSIRLLKIEAAKSYLHCVRMARLSAIGLMRLGLLIGLICLGVLIIHAGLFILLPWTVKAKAVLGVLLGVAYVVAGSVAIRAAMDERTWMVKSGATEMLKEATGASQKG
jgi:hypothetical protein